MKTAVLPLAVLATAMLIACSHKSDRTEAMGTPEIDVAYPTTDSVTLHRSFPGFVHASHQATVVARVSGTILSKNYTEGSQVKKGQPLFTIERSKYVDAVNQAAASLKTAQSQYDYYSKQYEAMKRALQADAVAKIEVVQAENNMKQAEASIQNAKAALQTARLNLNYCTVRAPISGHVTDSPQNVGNFVDGEAQPVTLCTIYSDDEMYAEFAIESSQYIKLIEANGGAQASIYRDIPLKFEAPLQHDYTANLSYTSPSVDQNTGTIMLKGNIKNPYGEIKDGMYVTIDLPYGTEPHAVIVRDASISTDQLGKYLYTVSDSNTVVYTPVTVGEIYQDSLRIIEKGITAKDRYVTKALLTVHAGEHIKPVNENAPAK